jgi:phosphoglycolate phosphatase-like HAD superfamily hydrolase
MTTEAPAGPWIVFALEGVLLDPRPAVEALLFRLCGIRPDDIRAFRDAGGYDDDWELARAASVWIRAGRPRPIPTGGWRRVVNAFGDDPGDLSARCAELYRKEFWRFEAPLIDGARLRRLSEAANLAVCTGRTREQLARAEELLGFRFAASTTAGDPQPPDPAALLRLAPRGHFFGRTEDDRRCAEAARFLWQAPGSTQARVDQLLTRLRPRETGEAARG